MPGDPSRPATVKRKYSRRGCRECKRRKIKCDEAVPSCGTCVRVATTCIYPDPEAKNRPRRRNPQVLSTTSSCSIGSPSGSPSSTFHHVSSIPPTVSSSSNFHHVSPIPPTESSSSNFNHLSSIPPTVSSSSNFHHVSPIPPTGSSLPNDIDMLLFENVFDDANNLVHGLADFGDYASWEKLTPSMSPDASDRFTDLKPFHSQIILNNSDIPQQNSNFDERELEMYLQKTNAGSNPMLAESWNVFSSHMRENPQLGSNVHKTSQELVKIVVDTYSLSQMEQTYFSDFIFGSTSFYFFPFFSKNTTNEVSYVLLEYSMVLKFMVYAMMSLSASCHYTITKQGYHETNQKKYTHVCTKLLVQAFTDLTNNESSLWHIEGLILTVIILAMLFSDINRSDTSQTPVSWVVHLDNARSLLIKYTNMKAQSSLHRPDSLGIVIAKSLFFCYDWNTNMCLPINEIKDNHLNALWTIMGNSDAMVADHDHIAALMRLGIMIPASKSNPAFNTFSALTPEVLKIIYEILTTICYLNIGQSQGRPNQASPEAITNIMVLINQALKQNVVPGVSSANNYVIDISNPAHPQHPNILSRILLPDCAYGIDRDSVGQIHYSWCDVVIKSQVYFLYLKILTSRGLLQLPRGHPLIMSLIEEIMDLLFFIKPKNVPGYNSTQALISSNKFFVSKCLFDHRAIMIQFPFRLCMELTDSEDDFDKLELFFEGLVLLGCGNCISVAKNVRQKRVLSHKRRLRAPKNEADVDYSTTIFDIY